MFAISVAVLLLFQVTTARGYTSTTVHGCAPPVPPLIPGSPAPPPATPGIVLINEVLNNPHSTWNCAEPATTKPPLTDSWVELYNPQNQPFNLYAAHTSFDSGPNTFTFHFPFGASIAAHGYLVVFPDIYSGMLSAGNLIRLTIGGIVIDQLSIPALAADNSFARMPDGSTNWQITMKPTIDASNSSTLPATSTPVSTQGSSNSGSGSNGSGNAPSTVVSGKQPAWAKLQLPANTALETPVATSPLASSPTALSTNGAWDTTRRILLTVLVVALSLSLFCCWKLYSAP